MSDISVVIVTKNRAQTLKHCLGSLATQAVAPKELIVIDNNSTDSTFKIITNFSRMMTFPVRVFQEPKSFYPVIYNRGLQEARGKWVAFIDDDCVAEPEWLKSLSTAIRCNPETDVLLGGCRTFYENNSYSLATWILDEMWKQEGRQDRVITNFSILDNKNIAYRQSFLRQNGLKYDETRTEFKGAAEDADLGLQIGACNGRASYVPNMVVSHKDPKTLSHFLKKIILSQRAFNSLYQKWEQDQLKPVTSQQARAAATDYLSLINVSLNCFKKIKIEFLVWLAGLITNNFINHE